MIRRRIPTRRHILSRLAATVWQAYEDHWWLPLATAGIALAIFNS